MLEAFSPTALQKEILENFSKSGALAFVYCKIGRQLIFQNFRTVARAFFGRRCVSLLSSSLVFMSRIDILSRTRTHMYTHTRICTHTQLLTLTHSLTRTNSLLSRRCVSLLLSSLVSISRLEILFLTHAHICIHTRAYAHTHNHSLTHTVSRALTPLSVCVRE